MDRPQIHVSEDLQAAYHAALESCLVVEHEPPGLVVARGASTLDLLHRMSTNNMTDLEPGHIRTTVLTTAIGRTGDGIHRIRRVAQSSAKVSSGGRRRPSPGCACLRQAICIAARKRVGTIEGRAPH